MSDINKRGVENWLIEALKSYDGLMSTNPDKEHKWQAKLKLQALIQEQVRLARIDELKQARSVDSQFSSADIVDHLENRLKELKGDK